ncbi:hypothetical protein [Clostridium butyricum]|nr:hypothetical protein [Clostridium butyricum]NOW22658.1 hypothetical protein [Clostridium butyricum]
MLSFREAKNAVSKELYEVETILRDMGKNFNTIYDAKKTYNLMQSLSIIC